jgi:predicted CoA-binding protein
VPPIVDQAIKLKALNGKPLVVWMQLGIVNEQAAEAARKAGLIVVMDKCLKFETGELLFEKRGHRWALTAFGFEVWGETENLKV